MEFWQIILIMCFIAGCFVVWPVFWRARLDRIEKKYLEGAQEIEKHSDDTVTLNKDDHTEDTETNSSDTHEKTAADLPARLTKRWAAKGFKSRFFLACVAVVLPAVSILFYVQQGQRDDWLIQKLHEKGSLLTSAEKKELYGRLQQRTKQTPSNVSAWYLYATLAQMNKNIGEAKEAYNRVLELRPNSPDVMASLAQVLLFESDQVVTPQIKKLTLEALKLDPDNVDALGVAGLAAFQAEDFDKSIFYWEKTLANFPPNSKNAQAIEQVLMRAELALKSQGKTRTKNPLKSKTVEANPIELSNIIAKGSSDTIKEKIKENEEKNPPEPAISVNVKVSLGEKVRVPKDAVVFVYARAWNGPKMPLAIKRITVAQLPADITLDNSMSMAPGVNLFSFEVIELVARVSKSGNALPEKGDWQVTSGKVNTKEVTEPVNLIISKQI